MCSYGFKTVTNKASVPSGTNNECDKIASGGRCAVARVSCVERGSDGVAHHACHGCSHTLQPTSFVTFKCGTYARADWHELHHRHRQRRGVITPRGARRPERCWQGLPDCANCGGLLFQLRQRGGCVGDGDLLPQRALDLGARWWDVRTLSTHAYACVALLLLS